MSEYEIAFDVGGTYIKSAVLSGNGILMIDTMETFSSYAMRPKEDILSHLLSLIAKQAGKINDQEARISGVGFAFPGPFDYENGICLIARGGKYESLLGVNMHNEIINRLNRMELRKRFTADFTIAFENDAGLFALGEWFAGKAKPFRRSICLTIGTGTGSAFLEQGRLIKNRKDVPANGWLYNQPFDDSEVDKYISRQGILRLARSFGFDPGMDVVELALEAYQGNEQAKQVFDIFGVNLGRMLKLYLDIFQAEGVVIGGQIAKSYSLFDPSLQDQLSPAGVRIAYSDDTSQSTYLGLHTLLRSKKAAHKEAQRCEES